MAVTPELRIAMGKVDVATNKLGGTVVIVATELDALSIRFDALKTLVSTRMSDADVAEVLSVIDAGTTRIDTAVTGLEGVAASLKGIGADPVDPVPVPVPEPPPVEPPIV